MKQKSSAAKPDLAEAEAELFLLEAFLPYRLSVATNRISRLFARRYCDAYGLSIPEWRVMAVIGRAGTLSPGRVAEWAAMDKVKVSRAAASLVARGLLRQNADPEDGRGRKLSLTRKGRGIHRGVIPLARTLEAQLAAGLSPGEWQALGPILDKLLAHVQAMEEGSPGAGID
ncbi:MAG: MarR family transcriptional regulator [Rhodospirillales bacterium]|nr:MarR family transcriptional regulator [Rhodospirillales bacterium]